MKFLLAVALAFAGFSCDASQSSESTLASPNTRIKRQEYEFEPKQTDKNWDDLAQRVERVRSAVCRVELAGGGHGSGAGFYRLLGWTFILTAQHVVDGFSDEAPFAIRFTKDGHDYLEVAHIHKRGDSHGRNDLAILKVYDSKIGLLNLEAKDWLPDFKVPAMVTAVGYPLDLYPCVVSLGFLTSKDESYFYHTAGAFFGNSGGPLVDFFSQRILGVTVMISGKDGFYRTNYMIAVPIKQIREFTASLIEGK